MNLSSRIPDPARRFLGIFVHPVDVQSAGMEAVFEKLEMAGANAICITPKVAKIADEGKGVRFPPLHMDGHSRILDRPIWGRRELYINFFTTHQPDPALFANSSYQPPRQAIPPNLDANLPANIIAEAHRRGMQSHILIQPFLPPSILADDRPVYIDGGHPRLPQVADVACLNSANARAYALGLALDTVRAYPEVDGLFADWVEFGAYRFEDHFACFCEHCRRQAQVFGFDWTQMCTDVRALWDWLHRLDEVKIDQIQTVFRSPHRLVELLAHCPGWLQFLEFKARSVVSFYQDLRQALDLAGFQRVELSARGWPPPWNLTSGMDYRALAKHCSTITPKLFIFDYAAIPRWYGECLLSWNPGLTETGILDMLVEVLNLRDEVKQRRLSHYQIPAPGIRHPILMEVYKERIEEIRDQAGREVRLYPFAHAYMPSDQWSEMVSVIQDSQADGMWIQMFGYLTDEKIEILRRAWL